MDEQEEALTEAPVAEVQQVQPSDKELNFQALRESLEQQKRHNEYLQAQLAQQMQQRQQDHSDVSQYRDDDIPTYGELKKLMQRQEQDKAYIAQKLRDLEMKTRHSDYEEVVRNFLPDVLQEDPDLADAIKNSAQMEKLAYRLAKSSPKYHEKRLVQQNSAAIDKIVENTSRPQPATTARKSVTGQSEEAKIASMSDEDIMAMFNMAKARS